MKQQTVDEKGIAVHFKNCITNHFYRRKDYAFLTPGFAILQERATRDRKIERDSKKWTQFRTSIVPELYKVCE